MPDEAIRFPNDTQRHAVFGMTGSGKTQAALYSLWRRDYQKMPWYIMDYKGDPMIAKIPGLEFEDIESRPTKHPGLYCVQPRPDVDDAATDKFLWNLWDHGKTGLLLDEGYMLPRMSKAYKSLLTQGRSKRIPLITLSQRPAWINPFILSESEFIQVFYLATPADVERVMDHTQGANAQSLPRYHSYWYSVLDRKATLLQPVPSENEILDRFDRKRAPRRWWRI